MAANQLKNPKPKAQPKRAEALKKDKEPEVNVKHLMTDERTHKVLGCYACWSRPIF